MIERGSYGIRGIARIFRNLDNNGNRLLDPDDFKWGLIDYGIYLDDEDIRILVRYFDRNGDGVINFDEFLTVIKGPLNEARMNMVH